jgi:hypothetical protein
VPAEDEVSAEEAETAHVEQPRIELVRAVGRCSNALLCLAAAAEARLCAATQAASVSEVDGAASAVTEAPAPAPVACKQARRPRCDATASTRHLHSV